jgi:hypothetical protein
MKPIFLLSLPRSGSTMVQRILGAHDEIATESEPWVLIPQLYALRTSGIVADYNHGSLSSAVNDFVQRLPNQKADYYKASRAFADSLYQDVAGEKAYFLDKTPRYCFVAEEIKNIYPDAKYIVLWRNPLSVISSRFHSFGNKWRIYNYKVDLYQGLSSLIKFCEKNSEEVILLNYENLVRDPKEEFSRVFKHLELEPNESVLSEFHKLDLKGSQGDRTGRYQYDAVSEEPLEKYQETLCNPLRRYWAAKYIRWIGKERLALMGYELDELLLLIDKTSRGNRHLISDLARCVYGFLDEIFELSFIRSKISRKFRGKDMYVHR